MKIIKIIFYTGILCGIAGSLLITTGYGPIELKRSLGIISISLLLPSAIIMNRRR